MQPTDLQTRKLAETRLSLRALEDADFRQRLIADPRAAFEEELGVPFPSIAKIQVIEESADTLVLVLPTRNVESGELADEQLASVAGGLTMAEVTDALDSAWTKVKKAIGGGKFEVTGPTAVAGVRG